MSSLIYDNRHLLKFYLQSWKYPCAQVIFDSDPAPVGRPVPAQIEEMSQAMIRLVMNYCKLILEMLF